MPRFGLGWYAKFLLEINLHILLKEIGAVFKFEIHFDYQQIYPELNTTLEVLRYSLQINSN
jgi:hypothetical protein